MNRTPHKRLNFIQFILIITSITALTSCIKNTELVGYTFKSEKLDQIKPGTTSQNYVKNTLGSPSYIATYGDNVWYYISSEYETIAFFKPKVKSQKIIAITFGPDSMVSDVKEYSKKDAQDVALVSEVTKTEGRDMGIINQLLGNVGRFNSEPGKPKTISKPKSVPK